MKFPSTPARAPSLPDTIPKLSEGASINHWSICASPSMGAADRRKWRTTGIFLTATAASLLRGMAQMGDEGQRLSTCLVAADEKGIRRTISTMAQELHPADEALRLAVAVGHLSAVEHLHRPAVGPDGTVHDHTAIGERAARAIRRTTVQDELTLRLNTRWAKRCRSRERRLHRRSDL